MGIKQLLTSKLTISGGQTLVFFVSLIQSLSGFHWLKVMVQYTNVLQLQSIVGVTSVSDK
ncbi:hypothetical protein AU387_01990 [Bacillus halotolerans]|nr:hypothetical protein AU387_01990 [Bacillus halotolerans]